MKGFHPWIVGMIIVFIGAVLFMIFALYGIMSKNAVPVAIKECQTLCKYANPCQNP